MNIRAVIVMEYIKKPGRSVLCGEEAVEALNKCVDETYGKEGEELIQGQRLALTRVVDASISTMEDLEDRIAKLESKVSELESSVNILTRRLRALE